MASTSDDDDDEQQPVTTSNNHLRKCLLCNIEVKKNVEKTKNFFQCSFSFSNLYEVIIVTFVIDVYLNMIIM
jgi:hypothetical protein